MPPSAEIYVPGLPDSGALGIAEELLIGTSIELTVALHQRGRPELAADEIVCAEIPPRIEGLPELSPP